MDQLYTLNPKFLLVFYKTNDNETDSFYIEKHFISEGKVQEIHALTQHEMNQIGKVLWTQESEYVQGMVPNNVLHISYPKDKICLIWKTPAQLKQLYFSREITIPDGKYPIPELIWKYHDGELWIISSDGKTDKVYRAPFGNINENFHVCMGSASKFIDQKFTDFETLMKTVEVSFFNSRFTHFNSGVKPCRNNVISTFAGLKNKFPIKELQPTKFKLKSFYGNT